MYSMQHGDTRLRAPYVDTLGPPHMPLRISISIGWWGVLVGGDMLCCHLSSGLLTGPLYEEGLDIPLRSLCIDVVLIEYPQQYTSTRCPLKDYPWTTLRSHLG